MVTEENVRVAPQPVVNGSPKVNIHNGAALNAVTPVTRSVDTQEKFMHKAADLLIDYLTESWSGKGKVCELRSPDEIRAAFDDIGVPISLNDGKPCNDDKVLAAMEKALELGVRAQHPLFRNQLSAGTDDIGVAGEWLIGSSNINSHTYEVGPVFTIAERAVIDKSARVWMDIPAGEPTPAHEGLFTPGGSFSNLYAFLCARYKAVPDIKKKGMWGGPKLVAFCSEDTHYSALKAAQTTGLGADNLRKVKVDKCGSMMVADLKTKLAEALAQDEVPFLLFATAGTTVLGAFDPFQELSVVAKEHNMWFHVDAAWGGAVLLSPELRKLTMKGAELADSLTWNPHKAMNVPLACSMFINRYPGLLRETNGSNATYLFQPDKLYADQDIGDLTIQCGRKPDAFKLWLQWRAKGDALWARHIEHAYHLTRYMADRIMKSDKFVMVIPSQCTNVCFWYLPTRFRHINPHTATEEELKELGRCAPKIKARMQQAGKAMIGFQPLPSKGLVNFWRFVFAGALGLNNQSVDEILESIDQNGHDL